VAPGSPADEAGLQPGDVLVSVGALRGTRGGMVHTNSRVLPLSGIVEAVMNEVCDELKKKIIKNE
jgi:C-terminal processing protease CtpA/Prc